MPPRPILFPRNLEPVEPTCPGFWSALFMPWKWPARRAGLLRRECLSRAQNIGLRDPQEIVKAACIFEQYLSGMLPFEAPPEPVAPTQFPPNCLNRKSS
ncbi:hypothetical protein CFR75_15790 [Komagataeibacter xylinus]|uniref:Uncharacterized protein n=2 Tax=Komagataeibacter xylinus TaxID=28448 RepID=A0A318PEA8_KOMXY|nr:hypothetical protein CFR75_15790 [Komagataeibacter xylinus]